MRLTAAVTHEPPWYVARCLDVEMTSQGTSVEDALVNLKEALELYFDDAPHPESTEPPIIASVEINARVPGSPGVVPAGLTERIRRRTPHRPGRSSATIIRRHRDA